MTMIAGGGIKGDTGATGATGAAGTHLASMLSADATNATATMAASGLTVPVVAGKRYGFRAVLFCNDSVDIDGFKFDFDTSAAATSFRAFGVGSDTISSTLIDVSTTALGTDIAGSGSGDVQVVVEGGYEPSASGNFLVRFAQNAHTTGTLTLFRNSYLILWEIT